jgi:DNA-binding MarR family transcriptional regulator
MIKRFEGAATMPLNSAADDPLHDALDALRDVILAGERYRQAAADYLGITPNETIAVGYLYEQGEIGQTELARILNITTSSTTTLIDRLQANELAERVSHPADRRRYSVRLTDKGHRVLEQSRSLFHHSFDRVPADQLPTAITILRTIAGELRAQVEALTQTDGPLTPEPAPHTTVTAP